jgi:L-asparaginase
MFFFRSSLKVDSNTALQLEDDSVSRGVSINPAVLHISDTYQCFDGATTPKVLILFCGGTLIMRENQDGSLVVNDKNVAIDMLLNLEPRLSQEVADMDVHYIDNIDSSNMSPHQWDTIGGVIRQKYDQYDGFVITHGTDTMAFTASALSFVLQDIGKPVVLTGAQIPAGRIGSDARRNFSNAVRVATLDRCGIFLVFDGDIILGARSHKMSESKLDAFCPINWGLHGEIRIDIIFSNDAKIRHQRPLQFLPGFESEVVTFTLFPGFPPRCIQSAIENGCKGLVLRAYGSGNISYIYLDVIKLAYEKNIPVVVDTQCNEGATLMHLYDVGRQALDAGAIQGYDMSTECLITKLMWALNKHPSSYEEVRDSMHTNYTGELNIEGKLYGAKT